MTRLAMLMVCVVVAFSGCDPQALPNLSADTPEPAAGNKQGPSRDDSDEPKTPIVRSLLDAIEDIDDDVADDFDSDENNSAKEQLKRTLREADKELRDVLGKNSKRKIMEANKKPAVPVIGEPAAPSASRKPEKEAKDEPKEKDKPEDGKEAKTPGDDVPAAKSK